MPLDNDNRRARADEITNTLTSNERQLFDASVGTLMLHWAAIFGDRLSPLVVENMAAEAVLNMDVLDAVHGQPPQTDASWRAVAQSIAGQDEWVSRNLAFSDESAKAEIRAQVLADISAPRRMTMSRSGELDGYVENAVREVIETRSAQRSA